MNTNKNTVSSNSSPFLVAVASALLLGLSASH